MGNFYLFFKFQNFSWTILFILTQGTDWLSNETVSIITTIVLFKYAIKHLKKPKGVLIVKFLKSTLEIMK